MTELTEILTKVQLPVMEAFYTIQGEGFHQGRAAYFIRLGGCDVGCVWCDVKESWDVSAHPLVDIGEMTSRAAATRTNIVVVTCRGYESTHRNFRRLSYDRTMGLGLFFAQKI